MSYHGLGDNQDTPALPSVSFGSHPLTSRGMSEARSIQPNPTVARDLPWGVGKEAERLRAELERQRSVHRIHDHGRDWLLIGSTSTQMQALARALIRLGLLADDEQYVRPQGSGHAKIDENRGIGAAAIRAWHRFGREHGWNVRNLTDNVDAGWTWDWGRFLRVEPNLWNRIRNAAQGSQPAWSPTPSQSNFVYLKGGIYPVRDLMIDRIAKRLQNAGYLAAGPLNTVVFDSDGRFRGGDSGPFIQALKRLVVGTNAEVTGARWPGGFNFGPTDGKSLRVDTKVLSFLDNNMLLGERRKMNRELLVKVIGPVRGGFPKVQ
jgi:hypothetical protein